MDCSRCGATASTGQRFCGQCGSPLSSICPDCGHENPSEHRFCGACGASLAADEPPPSTADVLRTTERRVVSVLFIDLVGFTSFSEQRDPEDVRAVITDYFDVARQVIERFGGTIDKFIGDAVMAWWGATVSREDDAERGVRAALELVDQVRRLGERIGVAEMSARAGVMTGEVAVGPGGNDSGLLLGDLVNSASRLQSLAEPDSVFVGPTTASLVETAIEIAPAGTHQVKGRSEPIVAHRAVRVVSERGGRGRTDIVEPPFVGRAPELRMLKDALHATGREGRARLVSVVGQAGIGKSRLVWEFRKYVDGLVEDVFWHEGRSPAYGDGLALWALGEMIRRRAGIGENDAEAETAERLASSVAEHVADEAEAAWVQQRLSALLGIGDSVGVERTELFAAARAFFEGVARRGTVVLVFEDLHWADPSVLEFIEELPDWSQSHSILVVTMARPDLLDRRPDWGSTRRGSSSMYLSPLADDEMAELIEGAVPGISAPATGRIVDSAGGVPLFAVEMIRMLLGDGRLVVGDEGVEVAGDLGSLEVPSSIQAIVSARLDRLPGDEADLVRDAALLGQSFTLEGLSALREEAVDKLERRLNGLVRHEILELVRDPRSPERGQYRWVQSVLREVAYGRIAKTDRHELHLRAARWFRDLDDPELAPKAASHFLTALEQGSRTPELDAEVVEAVRAAIVRSQSLHAHEQILGLVEAALAVVPPEVEVDLREWGAMAAIRLNDIETVDAHTEGLTELATASNDPVVKHRAVALRGLAANETRRSSQVLDDLEHHLEAHPDLLEHPALARTAMHLARAHLLEGNMERAAAVADDAIGAVEHFGLVAEAADAMVTRGTAFAFTRPHHAMALLNGALAICEAHELVATKMRALVNIGYASPDRIESKMATMRAFEEAKRVGDRNAATFTAYNLIGWLGVELQLDAMEELLDDPALDHSPSDRLHALGSRAQVLAFRGDFEESDRLMREASELAASISDVQARLAVERSMAGRAILRMEFHEGFEIARRHLEESPFVPRIAANIALEHASLSGDPGLVAEAVQMVRDLAHDSRTEHLARWADSLEDLVAGRTEEAAAGAQDLVADLLSEQLRWWAFLAAASFARHLPDGHAIGDDFAREADEIALRAKAPGLREFLRRFLERD